VHFYRKPLSPAQPGNKNQYNKENASENGNPIIDKIE
jgi:hypothetical protein